MIAALPVPLSAMDLIALAVLLLAWVGSGWAIEHPPRGHMSVTLLMQAYRRDWMVEMTTRQPRIFDATILASLRQGTTFLTSAAMLSVGGVLALAGNAERLDGAVMGVGLDGPSPELQQLRLAIVALLLTYAAFKFVWSNRLFGYCAVVMASVPNDISDPRTLPRAAKAAELNVRAALNFNRGLRAVYFAFAALGWLLGPWGLILAVSVTLWTVLSREFASTSRGVLIED